MTEPMNSTILLQKGKHTIIMIHIRDINLQVVITLILEGVCTNKPIWY